MAWDWGDREVDTNCTNQHELGIAEPKFGLSLQYAEVAPSLGDKDKGKEQGRQIIRRGKLPSSDLHRHRRIIYKFTDLQICKTDGRMGKGLTRDPHLSFAKRTK